ncbi:hypothetical protein CB1_001919013 [Camelus ferus]|nr:hypothetical protein CB1_001919013 [Camelus ferus]
MEKQRDLVSKALGLGQKRDTLSQLKRSRLLSHGARPLAIILFPFVGSNKSFTICHQGLQLWAESSLRVLPSSEYKPAPESHVKRNIHEPSDPGMGTGRSHSGRKQWCGDWGPLSHWDLLPPSANKIVARTASSGTRSGPAGRAALSYLSGGEQCSGKESGEDRRLQQDGTVCVALPLTARSRAAASEGLLLWRIFRKRQSPEGPVVEVREGGGPLGCTAGKEVKQDALTSAAQMTHPRGVAAALRKQGQDNFSSTCLRTAPSLQPPDWLQTGAQWVLLHRGPETVSVRLTKRDVLRQNKERPAEQKPVEDPLVTTARWQLLQTEPSVPDPGNSKGVPAVLEYCAQVLTVLPAATQVPADAFITDTPAFTAHCCEKNFGISPQTNCKLPSCFFTTAVSVFSSPFFVEDYKHQGGRDPVWSGFGIPHSTKPCCSNNRVGLGQTLAGLSAAPVSSVFPSFLSSVLLSYKGPYYCISTSQQGGSLFPPVLESMLMAES